MMCFTQNACYNSPLSLGKYCLKHFRLHTVVKVVQESYQCVPHGARLRLEFDSKKRLFFSYAIPYIKECNGAANGKYTLTDGTQFAHKKMQH